MTKSGSVPTPFVVNSSTNQVLVRFTSDGDTTLSGFLAVYSSLQITSLNFSVGATKFKMKQGYSVNRKKFLRKYYICTTCIVKVFFARSESAGYFSTDSKCRMPTETRQTLDSFQFSIKTNAKKGKGDFYLFVAYLPSG